MKILIHTVRISMLVLCAALGSKSNAADGNKEITLENGFLKYGIDASGRNLYFVNRHSGINYLDNDVATYCAYIEYQGKRINPASASMLSRNKLRLEFPAVSATVDIGIETTSSYFIFKVVKVEGPADALTFLHIPLTLKGAIDEPFSACALALNDYTHVRQLPALQTDIWATCYKKFRQTGSAIALVAVPVEKMLPAIKEVMQKRADIPFSKAGGAWALENKEGYKSYIMNFGGLTKQTVDNWIEMCRELGFNQIDNHGGGFFNFGELKIDSVRFPNGWNDFRDINRKLKQANISSILHTYAYFIDKNSKYVTPRVSPDLGYFNAFTLAKDLLPTDTVITVNESTEKVSTIIGFFVRNSVSLRIGDELVEFTGVTAKPPYQFTGCKRGVQKTMTGSHNAGEKAYHLKEVYGRFIADPATDVFKEMARRTAEIVNEAEFSGIYLDAVDGGDVLGGTENFWYYPSQFIFEIARNLKRPVGMEMASMTHFWWHYRSRWQAWDIPQRGFKKFVDIHLAAIKSPNVFLSPKIKSNDFEHGVWAGDTSFINRYAGLKNGSLMLPLTLGWWSNIIGESPQTETTFTDDAEYLAAKLLGNNAGTAMFGGFDAGTRKRIPLFAQTDSILRQYEELRSHHYFHDTVLSVLRQPDSEFQLIRQQDGKWNFKPTVYHQHKVSGNAANNWGFTNQFNKQPLQMRIEILKSTGSYDSNEGEIIAKFDNPGQYEIRDVVTGVSGNITATQEKKSWNGASANLTAKNNGKSLHRGSWINFEYLYKEPLNIQTKQGLGVWVKGDGKGELLNLRLESPKHISHGARGDHYIKVDFKGWRYFELVELESADFTNYRWPVSDLHVYDSYRHNISFKNVNKFQVWVNNIPPGDAIQCLISPVKALPLLNNVIKNPGLKINGKEIRFPVEMQSGMYLEMDVSGICRVYDNKGALLRTLKLDDAPLIDSGLNTIQFLCESLNNPRVKVSIKTQGGPIINYQ